MNQQTALDILKTGANVFLTGSAGAGKTFLLNQYIAYLRARGVSVAVTASTGIAATHLGGMTVHSWSGLGVRESLGAEDLDAIRRRRGVKKRVADARVIIIDEVSMLSARTLECLEQILCAFRDRQKSFGGAQIIFCGDFFQLPPVIKEKQSPREKFAFMSPAWLRANLKICYLTESHRHQDDNLSRLLNKMRAGTVDHEMLECVNEKINEGQTDADAIKLHTHNAPADIANEKMLAALNDDEKNYAATTWGSPAMVASLTKSVLAPETLSLKKSARVMFVKNNPEAGYMNGTLGEVTGFKNKFPVVKTIDNITVEVTTADWTVESATGEALASYRQLPLRLAWAITVHKAQGMTLEKACINLTNTFEPGQGYVALSRVKTWDGLQMVGYNDNALEMDSFVRKADRRFRALSDEATCGMKKIAADELREKFTRFITATGGSNDPAVIARNIAEQNAPPDTRPGKPKAQHGDTHRATKALVDAGKNLSEIVTARGFKEETIIEHLRVLRDSHPDLDLSRFQSPPETVEKVRAAIKACREKNDDDDLTANGALKISAVRRETEDSLEYNEIRLARLFMQDEFVIKKN